MLRVPPGHRNSGQPLELPEYLAAPIRALWTHHEISLLVARKNSKTTGLCVPILSALCGPTATEGFAAAYVSLNREKAGVSWKIMKAIAEASGLEGLKFYQSPKRVVSRFGEVEFLSSDKNSGASLSLDIGVMDEIGKYRDRDDELVASLRSSTSAKDGRILSMSIVGDSPFVVDLIERHKQGDESLALFLHQPSNLECAVDDRQAWMEGNPGIEANIKSLAHMIRQSESAKIVISDQGNFRELEMNLPGSTSDEQIVSPADWRKCLSDSPPARSESCVIGFDLGSHTSMSAVSVLFGSGRLENFAAFPSVPSLRDRGKIDGVGSLYEEMRELGELSVYEGRVVPVGRFLQDVGAKVKGHRVVQASADRFRKFEGLQGLQDGDIRWPVSWRGVGHSAQADGSHDCRSFQKMVYERRIHARFPSLGMASAIAHSVIQNKDGNPKLSKVKRHSRIDLLQAAILACGLSEIHSSKPTQPWRYVGAV